MRGSDQPLLGDAELPDRPRPVAHPPADIGAGARAEAVCPGLGQHSPPLRPRVVSQAGQKDAGHPAQDGAGGDQEWLCQVLQIKQRCNSVCVQRQQGGVSQRYRNDKHDNHVIKDFPMFGNKAIESLLNLNFLKTLSNIWERIFVLQFTISDEKLCNLTLEYVSTIVT